MKETVGLGLLLFAFVDGRPSMYTVKELRSKPAISKEAGMVGPPFETMEDGDNGTTGTLMRLLSEETPFPAELITICEVVPQKFNLIPNRPDIFTLYGYGTYNGDPYKIGNPKDNDIEFAGWRSVAELHSMFEKNRNSLRVETLPILGHFRRSGHYARILNLVHD